MAYDVGQKVRIPITVRDETGTPADATVAIVVTRPDGTTTTPTTVDDAGTGNYHADIIATAAGPWWWSAAASGAVIAVDSGQFYVRSGGPWIVSLNEAKKHLNKSLADTTDDEELRDWIDASTYVIQNIVGAVVPRTVVEYHDGPGTRSIFLRVGPVLEVTEVREVWGQGDIRILTAEPADLVALTDDQYRIDVATRRLTRRGSGFAAGWPRGTNNIRVTYRVGQQPIRQNIRSAALELIGHHWRASQLASGRTRPREQTNDAALVGIAIPNRVAGLLGTKRAPRLGG